MYVYFLRCLHHDKTALVHHPMRAGSALPRVPLPLLHGLQSVAYAHAPMLSTCVCGQTALIRVLYPHTAWRRCHHARLPSWFRQHTRTALQRGTPPVSHLHLIKPPRLCTVGVASLLREFNMVASGTTHSDHPALLRRYIMDRIPCDDYGPSAGFSTLGSPTPRVRTYDNVCCR